MGDMNKSPKVLVVDDDPAFVNVTSTMLKSKGYDVEAAYNKDEAIKKVGTVKPDLILLDIMLEKLRDGFTICYQLKHDPELRKIPVLVVTAITEKTGFKFSPTADGEYFQADDFMEKPVKPSELLKRIEKLLRE